VVVLDKGRVVASGPIAELKGSRRQVFELRIKGDRHAFAGVLTAAGFECHETDEDVMRVFVAAEDGPRTLFAVAAREHVQVRHLRPSVPTLEDVFAKAVGEV
jgi:ABC-type uncharacterized transport system ATPase subunit